MNHYKVTSDRDVLYLYFCLCSGSAISNSPCYLELKFLDASTVNVESEKQNK